MTTRRLTVLQAGVCLLAVCISRQACSQDETNPLDPGASDPVLQEPDDALPGGQLFEQTRTQIENGEIRKAVALIDEAVGESAMAVNSADVHRSRRLVAAAFLRINNRRQSYDEMKKLLDYELGTISDPVSKNQIAATLTGLYQLASGIDRRQDVLTACESAMAALEPDIETGVASDAMDEFSKVRIIKARLLADQGNRDQAFQLMQSEYDSLSELYRQNPDDELVLAMLLRAITNVMSMAEDAEIKTTLFEEHQSLLRGKMDSQPDNISYAVQYLAGIRFRLQDELTEDPEQARSRLQEAREVVNRVLAINPSAEQALEQYVAALDKLDVLVKGQLQIRELVGTELKPLDEIAWVNGDPVDDNQRLGSVVMLDFWAIWNGPSRTALERYKTLQEKYADHGLKIIGVTRYFNIDWDFERQAPRRSTQPVSPNTENDALQLFLEQQSVPWPTVIVRTEQDLFDDYGVTGLPHVMLVDRKGKIRLIKVGSSDDITESLDKAIQELLAEE